MAVCMPEDRSSATFKYSTSCSAKLEGDKRVRASQQCPGAAFSVPRQHLPPVAAQLADLVSHHTFLKLVFRAPGRLTGTTLQGCNLQNLLCKCKCEAQIV